jgi:hypothetical protein
MRPTKNAAKVLLRQLFELGQHIGLDILPRHFYSEIPSIQELRRDQPWREPRSMMGIAGADLNSQLEFVRECTRTFREALPSAEIYRNSCLRNGEPGFGPIEADFLYCFVRSKRPSNIVQVGCGVSTAVCLLAAADENYAPHFTCIEPHPTTFLSEAARDCKINLIQRKFQQVYSGVEDSLSSGDLFFVDSSHTLGPAGEVNWIILETLPRLSSGVWVHFHDIPFPYDYMPEILSSDLFFGHEAALLYAFLVQNGCFRIAASLSMLSHLREQEMRSVLPNFRPAPFLNGIVNGEGHRPSSMFLRRV